MAAPVLQKRLPEGLESSLPRDVSVYLEITDADGDLRALPTEVLIDGRIAWQNDSIQEGFSGSRSIITDGYSYTISRDKPFTPGQDVAVQIHAEDVAANDLDDVFSFSIGQLATVILRDTFSDGSVGLSTSPKNGTITEPAGTQLVISAPTGQDCNWWTYGTEYAPIAYFDLAALLPTLAGGEPTVIEAECELSDWSTNTANSITGLVLFNSYDDMIAMAYYAGTPDVRLEYIIGNYSAGNYGTSGTVTPPSSSNHHLYRLTWNPTDRTMLSRVGRLDPGQVVASYSTDGGATWTENFLGPKTPGFTFSKIGMYVKKWTASAESIAYYDWLHVRAVDSVEAEKLGVTFASSPGIDFTEVPPRTDKIRSPDKAKLLDSAEIVGTGGPSFKLPDEAGDGQLVPGPTNQTVGTIGPLDAGKLLDSVELVEPQFDEAHVGFMTEPGIQDAAKMWETLSYGFADAYFMPEKDDADGYELLAAGDVKAIDTAEMNQGAFASPVPYGFYGYAADGKSYVDGEETSPGAFSDASNFLDGYWRNRNVEPEKTTVYGSITVLGTDSIRMSGTNVNGTVWDRFGFVDSARRFILIGDFDISVDVNNFTKSTGSPTQVEFRFDARAWNNHDMDAVRCITVIRDTGSRNWRRDSVRNGSCCSNVWESSGGVPTGTYKLRIMRTGTTMECFYDTGGGWVSMGGSFSEAGYLDTQPVYIEFDLAGYQTGSNGSIDLSNFQILSGTWSNRASWYREVSSNRGKQTTALVDGAIASTNGYLDILDRANTKLWMRFVQGSNNIFGTTTIQHVRWMPAGFFLVAQGTVGGSSGSLKFFSLMWDTATQFLSTGYQGYKGFLEDRNSARSFFSLNTSILLPSSSVLHCDGYAPEPLLPGDEWFAAAATGGGMAVTKFTSLESNTYPPEYSTSSETSEMRWCAIDQITGELFYSDADKMYSRDRTNGSTGWEDVMTAGSWTREYEKALPGHVSHSSQHRALRYDPYLFVARREGVYRVDWPSGSWTLFYGKPNSGAVHEILPAGEAIAIGLGDDGSEDLLIVSLDRAGAGQLILIRLSDNSIYGRSKMTKLKPANAVAA